MWNPLTVTDRNHNKVHCLSIVAMTRLMCHIRSVSIVGNSPGYICDEIDRRLPHELHFGVKAVVKIAHRESQPDGRSIRAAAGQRQAPLR